MDTKQVCKECGGPLPAKAPQGLCPKCLMKVALGSEAGNPDAPKERIPAVAPAELARHFPQLEIVELLGQGGMGAVYKARQRNLDRWIALKVLPPHSASDPGFAERFNREARALARLSHPSIVAVYDFGQANGLHYVIMEYVDGLNLRQLEQAGKLPPREALQIIPQICEALQFAHDEGIVHRDIKPENVLLDKKGRVKIADFGLARILGREPESFRLTGAKDLMGTPHYMAPEQIEHPQAVDHRADIYSLGVVFYEMLTGELPLGRFAPPSKKVQVDVRLDEVVLRSLERDVELRYQNASDVKSDVETITNSGRADAPVSFGMAGPPTSTDREAILKRVRKPAMGLFITGILYWIIIPFTFVILWRLIKNEAPMQAANLFLSMGILPMVVGTLMILAGQKMKCLEAYWLAVLACILPMAALLFKMMGMLLTRSISIGPADLVGAPIGLWALVVLSRPEVKAAFGRTTLSASTAVAANSSRKLLAHLTWALPTAALILALGILGGQLIHKAKMLKPSAKSVPTPTAPSGNGELEFRLVAAEGDTRTPADELTDPNDVTGQQKLRILQEVLLDSSAVASAHVASKTQSDLPYKLAEISILLKADAAKRFADITASNISRRLAVVWRGRVLSAPVIRTPINGPAVSVTGLMSDAECLVLLDLLNYKSGNASSPSFGPVIERVVSPIMALDFDTDSVAKIAQESHPNAPEVKYPPFNTMRKQGMDVYLEFNSHTLLLRETNLKHLSNEHWTAISPRELAQTMRSINSAYAVALGGIQVSTNGPATYGFQTREGSIGLLQITGFTDNPPGVKIRYKLVK